VLEVGFALIIGLPFMLGAAAMALPVPRPIKLVIALAPMALLALAAVGGAFWIGDLGAPVIALIATWAWLLGVALNGAVRTSARAAKRLARI
jgi:hypothetical protein